MLEAWVVLGEVNQEAGAAAETEAATAAGPVKMVTAAMVKKVALLSVTTAALVVKLAALKVA